MDANAEILLRQGAGGGAQGAAVSWSAVPAVLLRSGMLAVPADWEAFDVGSNMKAQAGDPITCKCGRMAGEFCLDVADDGPIGQHALQLDTGRAQPDHARGAWLCLFCDAEVARTNDGAWVVHTPRGWIA